MKGAAPGMGEGRRGLRLRRGEGLSLSTPLIKALFLLTEKNMSDQNRTLLA